MFLFPYATDAPLYYRPIGTMLLIAVNVICFMFTGLWADTPLARTFALEFGTGLHPVEWISCHFLHYDLFHLLGNMFFLFIFGFIIEGKIGTFPFLLVYFVIGWMSASFAQVMVQWDISNSAEEAGGASMIIFGMMLISLLWAPKNEISFYGAWVMFFMPRVFTFDASVLTVGIWYFCLNLFIAWLYSFAMSSATAHVLGGAIGAGIGALMLKLKWVDCEGWDLFSLMKEDPTRKSMDYYKQELYAAFPHATPTEDLPDFAAQHTGSGNERKLVKRLLKRVGKEDVPGAIEARNNLAVMGGDDALSREQQEEYIRFLLRHEQRDEAIVELERFVGRFPAESERHTLKLCELLLSHRNRPSEAMHRLATMDTDLLEGKLSQMRRKLIERADEMLADGFH